MTTLRGPFEVTHTKQVKGIDLTYVSWSQVADRLDEAAPGWSFTIVQLGADFCWGRLVLGDQTFENVGYAENADADWKKEPLKDAVSDALKRCAALAGVARYLYDKDSPAGQRGTSSPAPRPTAQAVGVSPAPTANEPPWPGEPAPIPVGDMGSCPEHHKPFRDGKFGWYCASKDADGNWCKRKPKVAA